MKNLFNIFMIGVAVCMVTCDDVHSEDFIYPCGRSDIAPECVKEYFADNSDGSIVTDPQDTITHTGRFAYHMPSIGLDAYTTDNVLSQFDHQYNSFYIDPNNDEVIMAIEYTKGVICKANNTELVFNKERTLPKCIQEFVKVTYRTIITGILKLFSGRITRKSIEEGQYSAQLIDGVIPAEVGPKFSNSDDKDVNATFWAYVANQEAVTLEILVSKASYLFTLGIQAFLADFDIDPSTYDAKNPVVTSILENGRGDESQYKRPCESSSDMKQCAAEVIESSGSCSIVTERQSEIVRTQSYMKHVPCARVSTRMHNTHVFGLNGQLLDFFIDDVSKNMVITFALDYKISQRPGDFICHQAGTQPAIKTAVIEGVYNATVTGTVNIVDGFTKDSLELANVVINYNGPSTVTFGPKINDSEDERIQTCLAAWRNNKELATKELGSGEALKLFIDFVQTQLNDCGIVQ